MNLRTVIIHEQIVQWKSSPAAIRHKSVSYGGSLITLRKPLCLSTATEYREYSVSIAELL